jgi:FMN phosphatase YigB (HAD superfamily)
MARRRVGSVVRDLRRKTIAIDFDGVLTTVDSEAREVLRRLHGRAKLVVFTARRDTDAVWQALQELGIAYLFENVTYEKPRADMYVDDHGFYFTGDWEAVDRAAAQL